MAAPDIFTIIRNARQQGQYEMVIDAVRRLTASKPNIGKGWEELLNHALAAADEDAGLEIAKVMQEQNPRDPKCVLILAERFSRVGKSEIALMLVERLKKSAPANPALDYFHGVYSGHLGKLDEAAELFRAAIRRKPDFGDAWALLASTNRINQDDKAALQALLEKNTPHALPGAAYALGSLMHQKGKHEQAWQAWSMANAFDRKRRSFNLQGELNAMKDIQAAFDRMGDELPAMQQRVQGPRPVFIVGAARSGTSLTEQIVAATAGTRALGETMLSRIASWPLGNLGQGDMQKAGAFEPGKVEWARMEKVFRGLSGMRSEGAPVVTDKGAILHLFVGAMAHILPDARFIWVRRDPRDIAFSAWRAYFADGNRWRNDLSDSAAYLKGHEEMMQFWQDRMPDRVMRVDYETLASEPQSTADDMLGFLDLPRLDLSRTNFERSNVPTASFAQIRGKISTQSVGGWKAYEKWIGPAFGHEG